MERSENDSWDVATSVGVTATMVASVRAAASRQTNPIINDPFAEPLVRAAGVEMFTRLASGDLEFSDIASGWFVDFFAVRTRFFDGFFPEASSAGIRQAVIVASGLDSRAYRLKWPTDNVVYEIDQPAVIAFKGSTLSILMRYPRRNCAQCIPICTMTGQQHCNKRVLILLRPLRGCLRD